MATKYRAVCNDCDFRGHAFEDKLRAKKQRNKHQENYPTHEVGIEVLEEVFTYITAKDLENPKSTVDKKGL